MSIDWNVIATGLLAPVAVLIVKTILDFKSAPLFVKYFWWIPVRGMFRSKPIKIAGMGMRGSGLPFLVFRFHRGLAGKCET